MGYDFLKIIGVDLEIGRFRELSLSKPLEKKSQDCIQTIISTRQNNKQQSSPVPITSHGSIIWNRSFLKCVF